MKVLEPAELCTRCPVCKALFSFTPKEAVLDVRMEWAGWARGMVQKTVWQVACLECNIFLTVPSPGESQG